ncbi:MAG: hypothetical protein KBH14_04015 [Vicinamibacteria bacterium]|nr:hypothetical protein [Vicinamibacteria bacterium]MBP9945539.1 hypothetical protein [Vicinamibacteria bacterium]
MESGKRQKRVSEPNPISVDGYDMIWEKRHPIFLDWRKELKGVSVSVWIRPGKTKELILDVHFATFGVDRMPNPDRWNQVLALAVRSAMEAGWDPESRGAAFRHTPAPSVA